MDVTPSASYSITLRLEIQNRAGMLGRVTSEIGRLGGDIGAIDIVSVGKGVIIRDITVNCRDTEHAKQLVAAMQALEGVKLVNYSDRTFLLHLGGKIEVVSRVPIRTRDDLSMAYTPGVARVCMAIYDDPDRSSPSPSRRTRWPWSPTAAPCWGWATSARRPRCR
ncbi:MAG: hypothetical protein KatS3mg131_3065 [Candidatus Tectimicrobiota bacterium]|nr:MAG: hypothetical protein KatS3mg131_3065 [Candidatus Tectomicrobia bacterium]